MTARAFRLGLALPALLAVVAPALSRAQTSVDLLRAVPAQIVVSSATSPRMSGPSRMVDGRVDSAWNSRSRDLVGAWLAVQLPADARVTGIRLIPGYVRNYQGVAQWERNHRITRVSVQRDGVVLGEYDLDPARQEPQTLPVSGPGGLWRIEVRATVAGTTRSYAEACITELEVLGIPGATRSTAGPVARVATLMGNGASARIAATGRARVIEYPAIAAYGDTATGDVPEAERALRTLVQGAHLTEARIRRVLERGARGGDRSLYVFYYLHPFVEGQVRERMARRRAGTFRREDCADQAAECPALRLARVSVPSTGLPVVDGDVELATDACDDESETIFRDFDADGRDELRVRLSWSNHPVCPIGSMPHRAEWIFDERTLRSQFHHDLRSQYGASCPEVSESRRQVVDRDGDGHPDFDVHVRGTSGCEGEADHETSTALEHYRYDSATDAWIRDPPAPAPAPAP